MSLPSMGVDAHRPLSSCTPTIRIHVTWSRWPRCFEHIVFQHAGQHHDSRLLTWIERTCGPKIPAQQILIDLFVYRDNRRPDILSFLSLTPLVPVCTGVTVAHFNGLRQWHHSHCRGCHPLQWLWCEASDDYRHFWWFLRWMGASYEFDTVSVKLWERFCVTVFVRVCVYTTKLHEISWSWYVMIMICQCIYWCCFYYFIKNSQAALLEFSICSNMCVYVCAYATSAMTINNSFYGSLHFTLSEHVCVVCVCAFHGVCVRQRERETWERLSRGLRILMWFWGTTGDGTGTFNIDTSIEKNYLNSECSGGWSVKINSLELRTREN